MKKNLFAIFLLTINVINCFGQYEKLKEAIDRVQERALPYELPNQEQYNENSVSFTRPLSEKMDIPFYIYKDYECMKKISINPPFSSGVCRFIPKQEDIDILLLGIWDDSFSSSRYLLVTFDKNGKRIDYIEVMTSWESGICLESFKIDTSLQIVVSKLTPISPVPLEYKFSLFNGYRTDTYYQIKPDGRILKNKEILYESQQYKEPTKYEDGRVYFISPGTEKIKSVKIFDKTINNNLSYKDR